MKRPAIYLLILLFSMRTVVFYAQNTQKLTPKFTLTIYDASQIGGGYPFRSLRVVETNTSNEPLQEAGCWEDQGVFYISILYNGLPLKERDTAVRKKREADAKQTPCKVPRSKAVIPPGESGTRYLNFGWDYPMCQPGTYEITVSRESDLEHPEKSVTVKSNTLTIVVPESATCDL